MQINQLIISFKHLQFMQNSIYITPSFMFSKRKEDVYVAAHTCKYIFIHTQNNSGRLFKHSSLWMEIGRTEKLNQCCDDDFF